MVRELLNRVRMSLAAELLGLGSLRRRARPAPPWRSRQPFCPLCTLATEPVPLPGCRRCAEPVEQSGPCPRCLRAPPPFRSAHAALVHTGPLARAIHRFKYEGRSELRASSRRALATEARAWLDALGRHAVLVPVPLHRGRLLRRGYDQAGLLTRALARRNGSLASARPAPRPCYPEAGGPHRGGAHRERARGLRHARTDARPADGAGGRRVHHRGHGPGSQRRPA